MSKKQEAIKNVEEIISRDTESIATERINEALNLLYDLGFQEGKREELLQFKEMIGKATKLTNDNTLSIFDILKGN